ncbi:Peptidase family S51 [Collimonas sp. OK607]|uniref:cyanophycinase n=1 Tax=Collimonas sp. OK607 TaxID=1798194 RepID=UPI0008F121F9|nr:cyanophycinase [Collimonas sp. OK607]SFB18253.1 Peptidase family S51 [Collimonas sp. OK607]
MINKANCGGTPTQLGNVVVLRATGNGDYDKYIYKLGPVAAVQTLVIPDRASANDARLNSYIQNAAVIWIAAGDQSVYYAQWKGTLLENLIQQQIRNKNVPFGGTSAGLMMLGNFNYVGGATYSVTSAEALANPYNTYMNLQKDFWSANMPSVVLGSAPLPVLLNTVTDSHFNTRDRMGRTLAFMARNVADGWVSPAAATITNEHAIAVDEQTALLLETEPVTGDVQASIVTNPKVTGYAYFMNTVSPPMCDATSTVATKALDNSCSGTFTMTNTPVNRLTGTSIRSANLFDLSAWKATTNADTANFRSYSIDVNHRTLNSTGNGGSIY